MTKLRKAENLIKMTFSCNDVHFANAYEKMLKHFQYIDASERTNHQKAIRLLYAQYKLKYSLKEIAGMVNQDENTLRRHRKKYAECFMFFLSLEKSNNHILTDEIAAIDISEYKNL